MIENISNCDILRRQVIPVAIFIYQLRFIILICLIFNLLFDKIYLVKKLY